jgi:hypothetical protein
MLFSSHYDQGWRDGRDDAVGHLTRDPRRHWSIWQAAGGLVNHLDEYFRGYEEGYRIGIRQT